jgi:nicotinamide mononucleotide transporter
MTYINILDVAGSIFSVLSTIGYIRLSTLAWPLGIVAICIDMVLYAKSGIYGDVGLQCIYLFMSIYGWCKWKYGGKNRTELPITNLSYKNGLFLGALFILGFFVLSYFLGTYTDSQIPRWDATTTCLSLVAQWLICRKVIQNWYLWFIVDSLFVGMYFYKGIPVHALTNLFYLSLAVVGYLNWKKQATLALQPS